MSKFRDSWKGTPDSSSGESELQRSLAQKWPNLTDVLFGSSITDGSAPALPSCSVVLFIEGDRLKYCLTPQGATHVAFGTISEPLDGFSGLEDSLDRGDYAWRAKKGRR